MCSECPKYFLCVDCEEDIEHEHIFYKLKHGKEYKIGGSSGKEAKT
jgi:uncharacterized CHY-type Zn-finger protein